jgi:hypothetical protein
MPLEAGPSKLLTGSDDSVGLRGPVITVSTTGIEVLYIVDNQTKEHNRDLARL